MHNLLDTGKELTDSKGTATGACMKVDLSLETEPEKDFMAEVDAHITHLDGTKPLQAAADSIGFATAIASSSASGVKTLGTCVKPLGQALQVLVKLMDGISEVRSVLLSGLVKQLELTSLGASYTQSVLDHFVFCIQGSKDFYIHSVMMLMQSELRSRLPRRR